MLNSACTLATSFCLCTEKTHEDSAPVLLASIQRTLLGFHAVCPIVFMVAGGTGFVLEYLIDEHPTFLDATAGRAAETCEVSLYGTFSVFTTLMFWAFELRFNALRGGDRARGAGP